MGCGHTEQATRADRGRPGRDAPAPPDFESWLVAGEPALHRLAHLLAPASHVAADLVQTTLTKMYLAWPRVAGRGGDVDAYARRVLVNTHHSWWRRAFRRREVSVDELPDTAAPADPRSPADREALWAGGVALPARQRAVVALRFYEELSVDAGTGELLRRVVATPTEDGTTYETHAWEDDDHLLATRAADPGRRQLVRIGLDGTVTPLEVPQVDEDADLVWDTRP